MWQGARPAIGVAGEGAWDEEAQWQAQDVPQPPAAALAPSLEVDAVAAPSVDAGAVLAVAAAVAPELAAPAAAEPPRKSVTYQPEPLSWNPAAVTCLLKASAPQAGQVVRGESDIFCKTSLAWPQAPQR